MPRCKYCKRSVKGDDPIYCGDTCKKLDVISIPKERYKDKHGNLTASGKKFLRNNFGRALKFEIANGATYKSIHAAVQEANL